MSENITKADPKAIFKLEYGLYVVTSNDGKKDNGFICNTVMQVAGGPTKIAVGINKQNYSHDVILNTGKMNVNCLTIDAPFDIFRQFGFVSGRTTDKFAGTSPEHTENGLVVLSEHINAVISLKTEEYIDMGSHGLFVCTVEDAKTVSDVETMSYSYYHKNVKPKPQATKKKGFVCKICGYIYEGDTLPDDFICPICKHGASDFEPLK